MRGGGRSISIGVGIGIGGFGCWSGGLQVLVAAAAAVIVRIILRWRGPEQPSHDWLGDLWQRNHLLDVFTMLLGLRVRMVVSRAWRCGRHVLLWSMRRLSQRQLHRVRTMSVLFILVQSRI